METKSYKPEVESIHQIQDFVKKKLSVINNNEKKLQKIDLLIEELVINIVNYGCKGIENGFIKIMFDASDKDIILEISDNGVAFNPLKQKEPDISRGIKNRRPGGLGIFLVKQIAKEIQYARHDNKNIIRLCLDL
ncbi:MAG: ATP-binding protein [Desulfobacula sp.]|nr:ATP-binding protein [Desulfobacula sp.]